MEPSLEEIFGSYVAWQAKEGTWFINFMNGSENMYLLEGEEKALPAHCNSSLFFLDRKDEVMKAYGKGK